MKKYIGCLIVLLLILVPRTNSKYVLSDTKNLGVKTPGFEMVETTNGPVLIKDYKKDFIEIKIKNNGEKDAKGEIVIEGVKLQDIAVAAGKEEIYKLYLTDTLYNKLNENTIYPVKVNYVVPYKISKDITTIQKQIIDAKTIFEKIKSMNLGNDKDKGIDYSKVNSPTNGEGVYLFDETKNDTNPIYFFRGTHELKNNLLYAGLCWKIVRTTETGGVKVIYNGYPVNGKCTNTTGENTQIGKSFFNHQIPTLDDSSGIGEKIPWSTKKYVGYMYGDDTVPYQNINDSEIKKQIDNWYKANIKDKGFESNLDMKSIYCGDRTIYMDETAVTKYAGESRLLKALPTLKCPFNDSYSVQNGNKRLKYPVSLLSSDEIILAGISYGSNQDFYLYTNQDYWTITPSHWYSSGNVHVFSFDSSGSQQNLQIINSFLGIRPVVTLKGELPVYSGDGSKENPFVIKLLSKEIVSQSLGNDKTLGIDYSKVNSSTNGEGVYLFDETKNDTNPVYFFRGTHNLKNNLLYANLCWKIVRTTETGGVRIVYNGAPVNGKCTNTTGSVTQIGSTNFNENENKKQYVGYMFGDDTNPYQNTNDSDIKKYIDNWYKTTIKDKGFESSLDKGSIYCGDRLETKDGNDIDYMQNTKQHKPSTMCPSNDSYGVEGGNRKLRYPVGLLTIDEVMLAGTNWATSSNNNFYLYTNEWYWLLSPSRWYGSIIADVIVVHDDGVLSTGSVDDTGNVRPALTVASSAPLLSGDGSQNNPYVI